LGATKHFRSWDAGSNHDFSQCDLVHDEHGFAALFRRSTLLEFYLDFLLSNQFLSFRRDWILWTDGDSNYLLRNRVATVLGPIVKYKSGSKAGQSVAPDIEAWLQQDKF
jgi:hypothetical protein